MATRVREVVGPAGRQCALCGGRRVLLVRSWDRAGWLDRVRARLGRPHKKDERFTDECRDCGSRASVRATPTTVLGPRRAPHVFTTVRR